MIGRALLIGHAPHTLRFGYFLGRIKGRPPFWPRSAGGRLDVTEMRRRQRGAAVWHERDVILDLYEAMAVDRTRELGVAYRVRHLGWGMDLAVKIPNPEPALRNSESACRPECRRAGRRWGRRAQRSTIRPLWRSRCDTRRDSRLAVAVLDDRGAPTEQGEFVPGGETNEQD